MTAGAIIGNAQQDCQRERETEVRKTENVRAHLGKIPMMRAVPRQRSGHQQQRDHCQIRKKGGRGRQPCHDRGSDCQQGCESEAADRVVLEEPEELPQSTHQKDLQE